MTMRSETVVPVAVHHPKPLVIRGGLARTFGSLVSFLAVLFLILGSYLLGDAFEHPLNAQAVAVLAAAFSITLSAILLYFLLKPRYGKRPRGVRFRRAE
jgi:riboflavin transporter FmnP